MDFPADVRNIPQDPAVDELFIFPLSSRARVFRESTNARHFFARSIDIRAIEISRRKFLRFANVDILTITFSFN